MNSGSSNPNLDGPVSQDTSFLDNARLDRLLERKPDVAIPDDFAARVAVRAVAQPLRRRKPTHLGFHLALLSAALAGIALFVLAPHATPSLHSVSFDAQLCLLFELAVMGVWFARPHVSR